MSLSSSGWVHLNTPMPRRAPAGLRIVLPLASWTFALFACTTTIEGVAIEDSSGGSANANGGESSGGTAGSLTTGGTVGSANGGAPGLGGGAGGSGALGTSATGGVTVVGGTGPGGG